jgi:antitoxin MazE
MTAVISKWGNSAGLRLPKNMLEKLSLHIGDKVNLVQKGNTIVIELCKPSLDDLLSKVTNLNKHSSVIIDRKGNELL